MELVVYVVAIIDELHIVLESLCLVLKHLGQACIVALELLLATLANTFVSSPDFQLRLEISEALLDQLHVQDAHHAFLVLAERLELALKRSEVELDVLGRDRRSGPVVLRFLPHPGDVDAAAAADGGAACQRTLVGGRLIFLLLILLGLRLLRQMVENVVALLLRKLHKGLEELFSL